MTHCRLPFLHIFLVPSSHPLVSTPPGWTRFTPSFQLSYCTYVNTHRLVQFHPSTCLNGVRRLDYDRVFSYLRMKVFLCFSLQAYNVGSTQEQWHPVSELLYLQGTWSSKTSSLLSDPLSITFEGALPDPVQSMRRYHT